jgi:hypothetical protein
LEHKAGLFDGFAPRQSGTVTDRHFLSIQADHGIVDTQAVEGRKQVLYRGYTGPIAPESGRESPFLDESPLPWNLRGTGQVCADKDETRVRGRRKHLTMNGHTAV